MKNHKKSSADARSERAEKSTFFTPENVSLYEPIFRSIAFHLGVHLFPRKNDEYAAESYRILTRGNIRVDVYETLRKDFDAIVKGEWWGDPSDAPAFVRAHFEHLYFLVFYRVIRENEREPDVVKVWDIVMSYVEGSGFRRLVRNFDPQKGGWKYILKAVNNFLKEWHRSQKHRIYYHQQYLPPQKVVYEKFEDYEPFSEEPQMMNSYTETWELVEDTLLLEMAKNLLLDTLRRMSKYEYACVLRDYLDYPVNELAKLLNCEVSTLKSAMSRHRKQVKERLESAGHELRRRVGEEEWMTLDRAKLMETALVEAVQALSGSPCNPHSRR